MQDITLEFKKREVTGKAVKRVRAAGLVPAVIHDHGKQSVVMQVAYQDVMKTYLAAGKHHPVTLNGDGRKYTALIKTVTFDPKRNNITHVVFNAVKANEKVAAVVPVRAQFAEGNEASPAERAGLIVLHNLEAVGVEALARDLPDVLTFDGERLVEAGDQITVADLVVPAGVVVTTDAAQVLDTVVEPAALQAKNEALAGEAEPETAAETPAEPEAVAAEDTQPAEK